MEDKDNAESVEQVYKDLRAIARDSFPKTCPRCGRTFSSAEDFVRQTRSVFNSTGLKQTILDDDNNAAVELFRNCPCGSTLLEVFRDRRDMSPAGCRRRERFGKLLEYLTKQAGVDYQVARTELLKVLHGEKSEFLESLGIKM
jgi:hypothetical protein